MRGIAGEYLMANAAIFPHRARLFSPLLIVIAILTLRPNLTIYTCPGKLNKYQRSGKEKALSPSLQFPIDSLQTAFFNAKHTLMRRQICYAKYYTHGDNSPHSNDEKHWSELVLFSRLWVRFIDAFLWVCCWFCFTERKEEKKLCYHSIISPYNFTAFSLPRPRHNAEV